MEYQGEEFTPVNHVHVSGIGWNLAAPEIVTIDGDDFLGFDSKIRDDLPTEFFSHQFMKLDVTDSESFLEFMVEYGIPRHPVRDHRPPVNVAKILSGHFEEQYFINPLSVAPEELSHALYLSDLHLADRHYLGQDGTREAGLVCLDEARIAVLDLQREIAGLFDYMKGKTDDWEPNFLNMGLSLGPRMEICSDWYFDPDFIKYNTNSLAMTAAICEQVRDFIILDRPLWKCPCGRIFKRFQPRSGYASRKAPSRSRFCCERCRDKYNKAEYRKNKKNATSKAD